MYIISEISSGGATGYFVEYSGSAIKNLSMEARMTICNMSIEMGARGGLIAPDEITFNYLKQFHQYPGMKILMSRMQINEWKELKADPDAMFDRELRI